MTDLPSAVMLAECTMKNNWDQLHMPKQLLVTHCHLLTPYLIVKQQLLRLPTVKQSAAVIMSMPWGKVPCGDRISPRIRLEIHRLSRLHRIRPVALQISAGVYNGSECCLCKCTLFIVPVCPHSLGKQPTNREKDTHFKFPVISYVCSYIM